MKTKSKASLRIKAWRENPALFVKEVFGVDPDPWQLEVLDAFPKNQRLAMKACKGPGKTCVLAWLAWNFLLTRPHPKVAATSITSDNLSDGLWPEMAKWQNKSQILKEQFTWTKTRIFLTTSPETWFMSARTWPKGGNTNQQADTLAGLHADYLLFILDEAGGIPDAVMAAAEAGLATGIDTKILMAGNPTHLEGPLYRAVSKERALWHVTEITSDPDDPNRTPRVSKQWALEQIEKYGRDNPWVLVNVFGRFPPSSLNTLIGPDEVREAMNRHYDIEQYEFAQRRLGVDVARFGDDRCFDDITEILTSEGWKLFKDLHGEEKVLSVGANNDNAEWGEILHIHKAPFEGELNTLEKRHLNFSITDNHRLLVRRNPKSSTYTFKSYSDLPGDFVIRETNGWSGSSPTVKTFSSETEMPNGGLRVKQWSFDFVDWASFLGWFVSEGNVYHEKRKQGRRRIYIAQNPGANRDNIETLLMRMGIAYRVSSNDKQIEFSIRSIADYLDEQVGRGASNKRIPDEIKEGSEEVIQAFLDSFLQGDGTCRKDGMGRCYITSSKQLADDLQEILAKIGKAGSLLPKNKAGTTFSIEGREITRRHDTYNIYERTTFSGKWVIKSKVKKTPYKGFVWCVATPLESIYVRRKGVPMWSGNTIIFPRQGLAAFEPVEMRGARTQEIAARVAQAKAKWHSEMEFIDGSGGYGAGVVDALLQAGHSPEEVQFAGKPEDSRYLNKRAEMWFLMADWIKRGGALPNIPELASELTAPTYTFSNGKLQLEKKEQIKARIGSSPDYADALALTFSYPEMPRDMLMQEDSHNNSLFKTQGTLHEYDPFK